MARALPTGRTQTLGLIVTDFTNPVYFDLVRGAERAAGEAGYTMVLAESQESGEAESNAVERVRPLVDGLVLAAPRLDDEALTAIAGDTSLVLVNRAVPNIASVVVDVRTGLTAALDHLQAYGHRSIGYLSGPARSWINARRWEVLMEEAPRRGMHIVEIPTTADPRRRARRSAAGARRRRQCAGGLQRPDRDRPAARSPGHRAARAG